MKKLPLQFIFPVLIVMFIDCLFTLIGQDKSYWINPMTVNEGSPSGFALLSQGPLFFIIPFIFYMLVVFFTLKKTNINFTIPFALLLFIGHSWGSSTWLSRLFNYNNQFDLWYITIFYFLIISIITSLFALNYINKNKIELKK